MPKLKWSHYNLMSEIDGGLLIFNSTTGIVIKMTDPFYVQKIHEYADRKNIEACGVDEREINLINILHEKRVLVNADLNELDMLTYLYNNHIVRSNILELTLVVTRQCNYRCVYCYEDHLDLPMSEEVYNGILSMIEKSYISGQYEGVSISLFGGEPLLEYKKMSTFLRRAYNLSLKYNKSFSAGATTNGALLFPDRFDELNSLNCHHFQITLDGLKDTHERYRIAADGNGWDTIISNLKYMASTSLPFDVTIRTNFNDEILSHAEEFYDFVSENFDKRFNIYYEGIKHLGGINDEKVSVMDNVSAKISMIDISSIIRRHKLENSVCSDRLHPFSHICQATKYNSFIVDYNGTLLKCTLDFNREDNKIGYIAADGQMVIDHEKHCKWLTVGYENNDSCQKCRILPLCFGRQCVSSSIDDKKLWCNPEVEELFLLEQIKSNYGF